MPIHCTCPTWGSVFSNTWSGLDWVKLSSPVLQFGYWTISQLSLTETQNALQEFIESLYE